MRCLGILGVVGALCCLFGCSDSDGGGGGGGGGGSGKTVTGQVVDVGTSSGIFGVTVSSNPTTRTDANGFYTLEGLEGDEAVITFSGDEYATTTKRVDLTGDTDVPLCVMMQEKGATQALDSDAGGTVDEGDSRVTIDAGTLVDADGEPVTGDVEISVTYRDPSTPSVLSFPGSFDGATDMAGDPVTLESFGFATYEIRSGGETVQLADGETATIEYILPANAQDEFEVGDEIELWEFIEETGLWSQVEPNGTIQEASDGSGLKAWVAVVDHFSSWNCDRPVTTKHCLTGTVLSDGEPVVGAQITAVGVTYNGTSSASTGIDGTFCIDVKRGSTVRVEVRLNGGASVLSSQEVDVPDEEASCATEGCTELAEASLGELRLVCPGPGDGC